MKKRYGELDAFRGFAAIAVVFFHCTIFRPQAHLGFFLGISGVDLFFMISGFVIFMSINNRKNGKTFLLARFIRIYPIYWIIATFTFVWYGIFHFFDSIVPYVNISNYQFILNLTMVQYYFDVPNIDGSYWTLIIELLFYVFIYILYVLKMLKHITIVGGVVCLGILIVFLGIDNNIFNDFTDIIPLLYHFPLFYSGILFYKIFENNNLVWFLYPLVLLSLCLQFYLNPYGRATDYMSLTWYGLMLFLFSILFLFFIFKKLTFIANPFTKYLGDISYVLYLIHQPIVYATLIPLWTDEMGGDFWVSTVVSFSIVMFLATIITYKVEIPIRKYLSKKILIPK